MTDIHTILNQYQLELSKTNVSLRSAIDRWVTSGAPPAPPALLGAIAAETDTVHRFQRRLHATNPPTATDRRVQRLLLDALAAQAQAFHAFAVGAATSQPAVRVAALRQSQAMLRSATRLAWSARETAGCGKTC